ncbi:MAG: glycosyltransferase, partial [Coriobacteriia bacterium]|nr:glycosyltransferase [Coriobacteriia bacterium]
MAAGRTTRVLLVTSAMRRGGAQAFVQLLLEKLDRKRFEPHLLITSDEESEYPIPPDVVTHRLDGDAARLPRLVLDLGDAGQPGDQADLGWVAEEARRIAAAVRAVHPDVVFTSPEWTTVIVAAGASLFPADTRFVGRIDAPASVAFPEQGVGSVLRPVAARYLRDADTLVAVSHPIADDLVAAFAVPRDRIELMRNAVDLAAASAMAVEQIEPGVFEDGVQSVLYVGRLNRAKGLDYLLRAFARLGAGRTARLVIVGDGEYGVFLRALAVHLGLSDRVHFAGAQVNPFKYMARADLLVLPSLSEGLPTVLVEAIDLLANRVPCEAGVALVVAIVSAMKNQSTAPAMVILGDLSIQGNIKA